MPLTREQVIELWDQNWKGGWGYIPWSEALEGLTAEQAAWRPQPSRHSIWEIALHLIFWRDFMVRRARNETVSDEERDRRNHESPSDVSEEAWNAVRRRFESSQREVHDAIAIADDAEGFLHLTFHDTYHVGQIAYIRAMHGLPPIV